MKNIKKTEKGGFEMKKTINKVVSITIATSVVLTGGAICVQADSGGTLTIMGKAIDFSLPYYERLFESYEKETGNKLDLITLEETSFDTVATSKFATGDIPDIFVHHNNAQLSNYDVTNNFYYMNDEEWVNELSEGARATAEDTEGNILGLPFGENSISGMYYNKTLLDELGLEPATTQKEFDELCTAIKEAGYTPLCFPAGGSYWMYQFGMDPIFADNPEKLNKLNKNGITYGDIPEITNMIQWIKEAADKEWFEDTYMTDGWDELSVIMGTGEAVMIPIWDTWFYTDFDEGYDYTKEDFGVMPVFFNTVDEGTYEGGNLLLMMANKNSENLELALDFIEYASKPDVYNAAFDGVSTADIFKNQTTNIEAVMVTNSTDSINKLCRASTAAPKIIGFTQNDVGVAVQEMLMGNVDVEGCIKLMDDARIAGAKALGTEGF